MSPAPAASLRTRVLRGAAWNFVATAVRGGAGFAVKLILARLLLPEHFGLVGMATVFTGFVTTLNELGLGAALIQRKDERLDPIHYDVAFWTTLASGAATFVVMTFVAAPFAARFYGEPLLEPLTVVLSIPLLLQPFALLYRIQLMRELDFRTIASVEAIAVTASGSIAVAVALAGGGVWSIACQSIVSTAVSIPLLRRARPWTPRACFSWTALREIAGFGVYVAGNNVFTFLAGNIDYLLIGKMLGSGALGAYSLAFVLVESLRNRLIRVLDGVMYPAYSRMQDEPAHLKRYYLTSIRFSAAAVFPLMTTLIVFAGPFVDHVVGPKWAATEAPLRILAVSAMVYCVGGTSASVLRGIGRPDLHFRIYVAKTLLITIPALVVGIRLAGINGAALAVVAHLAASRMIFQHYMRRFIGVTEREILAAVAPAAAAGAALAAVGTLELAVWPPGGAVAVVVQALSSGAAYALVAGALLRSELHGVWNDLRPRLLRRSA
ncbi:MAG TPA: lipopolysaccharide biosynthesis protein [Longimicrobiales bacterium]